MLSYKINTVTGSLRPLNRYSFKSEGEGAISPQTLIYNNPNLGINIQKLEIQSTDNIVVAREFNKNRGPIDFLITTSNANVIIVEGSVYCKVNFYSGQSISIIPIQSSFPNPSALRSTILPCTFI